MVNDTAEIGIFGGTGIYNSEMLQDSKEITIETPSVSIQNMRMPTKA